MVKMLSVVFMYFAGLIVFLGCSLMSCCKKPNNKPGQIQQQPNPSKPLKVELPKVVPAVSQTPDESKTKQELKSAPEVLNKDKNIGTFDKVQKNLVADKMADKMMSSAAIRRQREFSMKEKISSGFYVAPTQEDDTLKEYPEPEEENTEDDPTNKGKSKKKKPSAAKKEGG